MILRFLTLMALVVSLAVPALATPAHEKPCPTQLSFEICHAPQQLGLLSGQSSLELPCGAKAIPCAKGASPSGAEREEVLAFVDAHIAWTSQSYGPPEKPPRI